MEQQPQAQMREEQITSLEHFAAITADWFITKRAQIHALVNFPEHESITVVDSETNEEIVLTGEARAAFIEGLKVTLGIFDRLPFDVRPVDVQPPVEATAVEAV